jgi:hypothetical protein
MSSNNLCVGENAQVGGCEIELHDLNGYAPFQAAELTGERGDVGLELDVLLG